MKCPRCDAELPPGVTECDCPGTLIPVDERTSACDPAPLRPGWPDDEPVPLPPEDRFEIESELRRGEYGIVWLARQRARSAGEVERSVAVRRLIATDGEVGRAFQIYFVRSEAVRHLEHRSIVPVLEVDQDEFGPYVVTEYVEGANLADEIERRGPFEPIEAARIGMELCRALHYAHTRPEVVCHGEFRPSRVLLAESDGSPRIMDFQLSRRDPDDMDPSDDVFALGAALYEMVTKRSPDPRIVTEEIPSVLRTVIRKATALAPKDRYATMQKFRYALARCIERSPTTTSEPADRCPSCGRHPVGDYRYCPTTGDELYRACPACGGENNLIGAAACVECGCPIDDIEKARAALGRGEEHLGEKKYTLALEEFERAVQFAGSHASTLKIQEEACASRDQASARLARRGKTREKLDALITSGDFGEAAKLLADSKRRDPHFAAWAQYEARIPRSEAEHLLEEARRLGRENELDDAADRARRAAAIDSPLQGSAEKFLTHTDQLRLELQNLEVSVAHHLKSSHYEEVVELCNGVNVELSNHPRVIAWRQDANSRLTGFSDLLAKGREALDASDWATAEHWFAEAEKISPGDDGRGLKGVRSAKEGAFREHLDGAEEASRGRRWKEALGEVELAREVFPGHARPAEVEKAIRSRRGKSRRRRVLLVVAVLFLGGGWFFMDSIALWRLSAGDVGTAALLHDWFGGIMRSGPEVGEELANHWVEESERVRPEDPRRSLECLEIATRYRPDDAITRRRCELLLELAAAAAPSDARPAVQDARAARSIADEAGLADLSREAGDRVAEYEEALKIELAAAVAPSGGMAHVSRTPTCALRFTAAGDAHVVTAVLVDGEREIPLRREGTEFTGEYVFDEEGAKELVLRVQNDLDVETTLPDPVRVAYDATPPVVVAEGAVGDVVSTGRRNFELRFTVTDASAAPLALVRARVDEGEFTDAADLGGGARSMLVRIPGDREEVTVTVESEDAAGNRGTDRFTVRYRTGESQTRLRAPEGLHRDPGRSAFCTNQPTVTLHGVSGKTTTAAWLIVQRAGRDGERIDLAAEYRKAGPEETTFEFPVELEAGDNVIRLFAADEFGNKEPSEPLTLCLDREAPQVGGLEPTAGDGELKIVAEDGVPLLLLSKPRPHRFEAEDASPPVRWFAGDRELPSPEIELAAGEVDLTIRAVDALGHESEPVRLRFRCRVLPESVTVRDGTLIHKGVEFCYVPAGDVTQAAGGTKRRIPAFLVARLKVTAEGGFTFDAARKRAGDAGTAIPTEEEWLRASQMGPTRPADMVEGEPEWVEKTSDAAVAAVRDRKYRDGWRTTCGGRFWAENPVPTPWAKDRAPQPIAVRFVLRLD